MSGTAGKLRRELEAAQRALAETRARCERHDAERQAAAKELEDNRSALLFMLEDLENARGKIERAHQEWMAALDVVNDPIFLHDKQFRILRCNKAYQQCAGVSFHELIGRPYYEIFPKAGAPLPCCPGAMEKAGAAAEEEIVIGDATYRSRTFSVYGEQGEYLHSVHILEDITEFKRVAETLSESEARFRNLVEATSDWIWEVDENAVYTYVSPKVHAILGYEPAEVLGKTPFDLMPREEAKRVADLFGPIVAAKKSFTNLENTNLHKDGHPAVLETSGVPVISPEGKFCGYRGIDRDITERKRVEGTLRESEERYRYLFENMLEGYAHCKVLSEHGTPVDFIYLNVNDAFEKITGLKDVAGKKASEVIPGIRKSNPELLEICGRVALTGQPEVFETYMDALGIWFSITAYSQRKEDFVAVFNNITERRQAEAAIQHANRALATLSAVNRTLVHASNEDELLQAICQAIVEQRGYRLAWVGYVQHDENKSIKIMTYASNDGGYPDTMQPTWAENECGMCPSGRAVRSGVTQLCQDIARDPHYQPWHDEALKRGYAASIALPLTNEGNVVFGTLTVYSNEVNAFTPNEIALLEEMAGDLAFGVRSLHTRRQRDLALVKNQEQLVQLQDSLEATVRAIATIVEMRDPYTAGHQARVADLAAAIAGQMGLPDEQVHAIHLAGVVHDLGKVRIPAEILSKPGKITGLEFGLIKIHPQAGYDILKGIDFPWPIAQMVLQHHERLDGSGYPQGLKGEAILLEARILAVADVVEAISAHRPYRPGLGVETALAEIAKQRGVYYDPQAVDACLMLFREQHYSFK